MAITNHDRIGKALELLRDGLRPFVARELEAKHGKYWLTTVTSSWQRELDWNENDEPHLDAALLLRMMWDQWNLVFREPLGHSERSLVSELREVRNAWAHQNSFSGDDTYRALDSAHRLLLAISAPQAGDVEKLKLELLRLRFDEQVRSEKRKSAGTAIESVVTGNLKPWREVVMPHTDVASGRYQQAEFAADLWQVHLGEGIGGIPGPRRILSPHLPHRELKGHTGRRAATALRPQAPGGDPVVQLQTNFGGGKTHSMLALYHLFSGSRARRTGGHRCADAGGRGGVNRQRAPRCAGGQQNIPRQSIHQTRRHGGAHLMGRAGLATGRQSGLRPHRGRRCAGHQPRRHAARVVQRIWPLPDPD